VRQSPLKSIHSTAGALEPGELADMESLFGAPILNGYGLSEAPGIAGERFPRERVVPGSVGKPWCEVEICDGECHPVAVGERGEITVRGATVFSGYLDDQAANAAAFLPDGWFRTGDVGFLDEGGYLHVTGRLDETINRGGEKIVPDEVDRVLRGYLAVAEAATFAVADDLLGQDIAVAVVLAPGVECSARDLRRWLAPCLSPYKIPRRVWFVERLPRTRTGKVQRAVLTQLWNEAQW
jgi:acyl-coenzyme A synthetase/AMP-(fatty) acid ligase